MTKKTDVCGRSLSSYFEPPDSFTGRFGWLCGYSADSTFLNAALDRFTGQTQAIRESQGQVYLTMMLDSSNQQVTPSQVPGLLHLGMLATSKPFAMLHAKIALLLFYDHSAANWLCRLIVSTGNWTNESMMSSIDVVWSVDVGQAELESKSGDVGQACADIAAAADFMRYAKQYFKADIIESLPLLHEANDQFENVIAQLEHRQKQRSARFIDNRKRSMLQQVAQKAAMHVDQTSRNFLAMGSGFFQGNALPGEIPSVLQNIVAELQRNSLLAAKPEISVYVNPLQCQSISACAETLRENGWNLQKPDAQKFGARSLHAKFLFSASLRGNSDKCNSAWAYIGSANLTNPGFALAAEKGGNLEAGVIFGAEPVYLRGKQYPREQLLSNLLPVDYDHASPIAESDELKPGADMPEPEQRFLAPPCSYLKSSMDGNNVWLIPSDGTFGNVAVLNENGDECPFVPGRGYEWIGPRPKQVVVRWTTDNHTYTAVVPIVDEFGRVAATVLEKLQFDDAWWQLAAFPMAPDSDDIISAEEFLASGSKGGGSSGSESSAYPIRQMMELVERVADKQTEVAAFDWKLWCVRVEQCLVRAEESPVVEEFRTMGVNPLSVLRRREFRPQFAEDDSTPEGQLYEATLDRVEQAWKVKELSRIGACK